MLAHLPALRGPVESRLSGAIETRGRSFRTCRVHALPPRTSGGHRENGMATQWAWLRSGLGCHLFIYLVRGRSGRTGYRTVLAYGRSLEAAERVAINRASAGATAA